MYFTVICAFDVWAITLTMQFSYKYQSLPEEWSKSNNVCYSCIKKSSSKLIVPQASGV